MKVYPSNNLPAELQTTIEHSAFIELSGYGVLAVSGEDAAKFLQGQLTCDIREVTSEQHRLGACCNVQGRVIATFHCFSYDNSYYLFLPENMIAVVTAHLKKYILFSKVKLEIVSDLWQAVGVLGFDIEDLLREEPSLHHHVAVLKIPDKYFRFMVLGKLNEIPLLKQKLKTRMPKTDENIWQLADIHAGIPNIHPQTSEMFTPHMINLPQLNAVSFDKGCYLGQEIIARTQHLGKIKRHLYSIKIEDIDHVQPGDKLWNPKQQEIGRIVNVARVCDGYMASAVIQQEAINMPVLI